MSGKFSAKNLINKHRDRQTDVEDQMMRRIVISLLKAYKFYALSRSFSLLIRTSIIQCGKEYMAYVISVEATHIVMTTFEH